MPVGNRNCKEEFEAKDNCMEIDYSNMRVDELETVYSVAERNLQVMLLNGSPWGDVQKQMLLVTQLSIALHKTKYPLNGNTIAAQLSQRK